MVGNTGSGSVFPGTSRSIGQAAPCLALALDLLGKKFLDVEMTGANLRDADLSAPRWLPVLLAGIVVVILVATLKKKSHSQLLDRG